MTSTPWTSITDGDRVLYFAEDPVYDEDGTCINLQSLTLMPHRVLGNHTEPVDLKGGMVVFTRLQAEHDEERKVTTVSLLAQGHDITHIVSHNNVLLREMSFVHLSDYRTFFVACGLLPWSHMIKHAKVPTFKKEFLGNREKYGMVLNGAATKLPYVKMVHTHTALYEITQRTKKDLKFPPDYIKQDPSMAFFRKYPLDLCMGGMSRDYFGEFLICKDKSFRQPDYSRWNRQKNSPHQLHIKAFIDSNYLNPNAKFLAHVLVDMCMFRNSFLEMKNPGDYIKNLVAKAEKDIISAMDRHGRIADIGTAIFRSFFNNTPPELELLRTCHKYTPQKDRALSPLKVSIGMPHHSYGDPREMYNEAIDKMKKLLPSLEDQLVFENLGQYTNRTLCVIPKSVAGDLAINPHIILRGDNSSGQDLIQFGQLLYVATMTTHMLDGVNFQTYPREQSEESLQEPPERMSPQELIQWLSNCRHYINKGEEIRAHCAICLTFWETHLEDALEFTEKCFTFAGGVFTRKNPPICNI
nr:hypothetical protein [Salmonid herpesvirus 1]